MDFLKPFRSKPKARPYYTVTEGKRGAWRFALYDADGTHLVSDTPQGHETYFQALQAFIHVREAIKKAGLKRD